MKIGIIGAGALGSLLGFYLSQKADVWLLSRRPEQIEAINRDGLRRELDGVEATRHPHASADPRAIGPCDVVLVLVKSYQTAWAAEQARALLRTKNQRPRTKQGAHRLPPHTAVDVSRKSQSGHATIVAHSRRTR